MGDWIGFYIFICPCIPSFGVNGHEELIQGLSEIHHQL